MFDEHEKNKKAPLDVTSEAFLLMGGINPPLSNQ
jgi:hypothetical protein